MTITPAQIQDRLAKLLTLDRDVHSFIAVLREDSTMQAVWLEGSGLTADENRVVAAENSLLTKVQNDAIALQ